MPLVFSLVQYTARCLWSLLHKVARLSNQSQSNTSPSAPCLRAAFTTLHSWCHHQDGTARLSSTHTDATTSSGPEHNSLPPTPTTMARSSSDKHSRTSADRKYASSTVATCESSGSGKKHARTTKRSDSEIYARSIIDALSGDEAESTLSWTTSSTIDTSSELDHDHAHPIQGALQLVPDGESIEPSTVPPPTLTCRFWFLNCSYASNNEAEWREHNLAHFRGNVPPLSLTCPLCDMTFNIPDPNVSWAANMSHLVQHFKIGDSMASAVPEYVLVRHLWAKRIISDADYQELVSCRRHGGRPYLIIEGRNRRERRSYALPQSRM